VLRWIGRLLLVLGGIVLAVLGIELFLRITDARGAEFVLDTELSAQPADLFQPDPEVRTRLRPGAEVVFETIEYRSTVRVNRLGLRGAEPGQGAYRVLALGDSFTMAAQVSEEQSWPEQLEGLLGAARGEAVEVLNAGVNGYGTFEAAATLERLHGQLRPDAVVLGFYLGNDLRDNKNHEVPPPRVQMPMKTPAEIAAWEARLVVERERASLSRIYAMWLAARVLQADDFRIQEYRDEVRVFAEPDRLAEQLPHTEAALQRLASTCERLKVPCTVALIPPAYGVHTARADATFEAFGLAAPDDLDGPARAIAAAAPPPLAVVDLTPALREAASEPLYYTFDPHWTPAGHRVAAEAIAAAITATTASGRR